MQGKTPFIGLHRWSLRLSGIGLVLALLVLWEASARLGWVESRNWPPFTHVLIALWDGFRSGEFVRLLANTMGFMLAGYAIGSLVAIVLGILLGISPLALRFASPLIETLRPIPITAVIPPLIVFIGVDDSLKVFAVAFSTFFPILINTISGIQNSSKTLLQTAKTLRLSRSATLWKIVLPETMPAIFSGLRTSLSLGLIVAIIAEMVAGSSGIGYFIVQAQYAMQAAPMYAAVLCLSLLGYVLNRSVVFIEKISIPWYGKG